MRPEDLGFGKGPRTETRAEDRVDRPTPNADPRRVVVIDLATDSVTTIIVKSSVAPGVGELRERIAGLLREMSYIHANAEPIADAVMRVILGEGDS